MGMKLFNKIINLEFLDDKGNTVASIKCPKKGRKPSIEINGQFTNVDTLETMNIKVKNLVLDGVGSDFPTVRVTAGYDDSTTTFDCQVFSMYQDSPGPESVTTIQCVVGKLDSFLTKSVSGRVEEGGSLEDALKLVSNALGFDAPAIDPAAAKMKTETQLCFDGMAREALKKIKAAFPLAVISVSDNRLKVFSIDEPPTEAVNRIQYMSAPVQLSGGKDNPVDAVVTAPWVPSLRCGSVVEFPTKFYGGKGGVSNIKEWLKMEPYSIQIQFMTSGTANKMVVRGTVKN